MNIVIVDPSVTLMDYTYAEGETIRKGLMRKIEQCGRIAYKSKPKDWETTERFIKTLVKQKHYSVLEHARICVTVNINNSMNYDIFNGAIYHKYMTHPRGRRLSGDYKISGNIRSFKEWIDESLKLCNMSVTYLAAYLINKKLAEVFPLIFTHAGVIRDTAFEAPAISVSEARDYHTFKIVTDRGIMAEWTRHRNDCSYTVESTRYCNDNKKGITVCQPTPHELLPTPHDEVLWQLGMQQCAAIYNELIERGIKPEVARNVLPMSLKTEFVATATDDAWKHFIDLRTAKDAHPQMRYLAGLIACELATIWDQHDEN